MRKLIFVVLPVFLTAMFACNSGAEYKTTPSGLTYKFHKSNRGPKPLIDEYVQIDMAYRMPADSVIYRTADYQSPVLITVMASQYEGDIYEGIRMMAAKDSASFRLDATTFFDHMYGGVPEFINPGDSIYIDIVMHKILNKAEMEALQNKERQEFMEEQEKLAYQEEDLLENYLLENDITNQPEESGLIIIMEKTGRGPKPEAGQTVTVHYTGKLLDGTVFDSSVERGSPIEFTLGRGQVIRGWDEGLSKLNVGSKATLIVPSYLGYGNQARGAHIKPFSTLVFDVELIEAN